jgi:adenylosuccinate lyase
VDEEVKVNLYSLVSPIDYRYLVSELEPYLSEEAFMRYKSSVEAALAQVLARRGLITPKSAEEIVNASKQVRAAEVYEEEKNTNHDIIALVNMIKKRVSDEAKPGVHKTATSYDIVEPANSMRYRDAFKQQILPDMISLEREFIKMAKENKDVPQIGRTHLQHAEPITFGFAMAWYAERFGDRILKTKQAVSELRGKFSGAVGAYNASALFVDDPEDFEREVLAELGLEPARISTQIVPPEPTTDMVHYVVSGLTVLANLADDLRNLQRPEIGEVGQPRGPDISRSSTLPHKANPSGLENVKSQWKIVMPAMFTMYLDQISDHQRDLTTSASQRNVPAILDLFDYSVRRTTRIMRGIKPHVKRMQMNLDMNKDKIIAEPLHLVLSTHGFPDAHMYVGKLADKSYETGVPLTDIVLNDQNLRPYLEKFTPRQREMIDHPEKYLGIASQKAEKVANEWEQRLKYLEKDIKLW